MKEADLFEDVTEKQKAKEGKRVRKLTEKYKNRRQQKATVG